MNFETLKRRWDEGRITEAMLRVYVRKGVITATDFKTITGIDY